MYSGVKALFQVLLVKQSVNIQFTLTYESALSTQEKTVEEEEAWITRYLYNPFLHLKPTPQPHRQPRTLSLPSNRLHSLRVIKQFRRIINTLNILQPR
jgi:membrane-bound lytic murein transglycosylase